MGQTSESWISPPPLHSLPLSSKPTSTKQFTYTLLHYLCPALPHPALPHPPGAAPGPTQTVPHPPSLPRQVAAGWLGPGPYRHRRVEGRRHTNCSAVVSSHLYNAMRHTTNHAAELLRPPCAPLALPSPPLVLEHAHHQLHHEGTGQHRCARPGHRALLVQSAVAGRLGSREGEGREVHR